MSDKLDDLLKNALTPSEEPGACLNKRIIQIAKGDITMRKPFFKSARIAIAAVAAVLAAGSITTYAAWKYLSMDEVAKEVKNDKLAEAFQGKDAIRINESQTYGDYKVTLLGSASGKSLTKFYSNGIEHDDRTYVVSAIEKKDGSAMPKDVGASDFLVTPFIKGEKPWQCNIFYMNGGASTFVKDGVLYCLSEWDNYEVFAKRGVYLGVLDETFCDNQSYNFDEKTGEITRNEDYKGLNALFVVPMDESKADEEAADALLEQWQKEAEGDDEEDASADENTDSSNEEASFEEDEKWDIERIQKEAVLIKNSVKTVKADKDGMLYYSYNWKGHEGSWRVSEDNLFREGQTGLSECFESTSGSDVEVFVTFFRNEDGTVTISLYHTK